MTGCNLTVLCIHSIFWLRAVFAKTRRCVLTLFRRFIDLEATHMTRVLYKCSSEFPPCVIANTPDQPETLLIGTYLLDKERNCRSGTIDVYRYDNVSGCQLNLLSSVSIPESSVLDLKISPFDPSLVVSAQSTGKVVLWKFEDNKLQKRTELVVSESDILALSVSFVSATHILVTLTDGSAKLVPLDGTDNGSEEFHDHSLECWIAECPDPNVIYTGGDDSLLIARDRRVSDAPLWSKRHDAGVVSILSRPENQLWVGGYDDTLRSYDIRMMGDTISYLPPKQNNEVNLGGGVWRLIPQPANSNRVLACCMYGGARIVDGELNVLVDFQENHESMVYGGAWIKNDLITCSFYDKLIQVWSA